MIDRELIIKLLKIGVPKIRIAEHLSINRKTLYRYLKANPITEVEFKNIDGRIYEIDRNSANEQAIKSNDNDKPSIENTENILPKNWETMTPNKRRAYLDEMMKKDVDKILDY